MGSDGIAIGRRAWLFAGSDRGRERAAAMFTLIETAKLNESTRRPGSPTCFAGSMIGSVGLFYLEPGTG